ncbi:uncharacterized protein [Periplaneta americana]|uniref:uncharacterized protein n=1 Tax=Periplaneta americana TaxID=6978 RepID=UPI0037E829F7
MKIQRSAPKFSLVITVILVMVLTTNAASPYLPGLVCVNSTHFQLNVISANGSLLLLENLHKCPANTTCNISQCVDAIQSGQSYQNYDYTRKCNTFGFICTSSYEYELCKYSLSGMAVPSGQRILCPTNTVCNDSNPYHCSNLAASGSSATQYVTPQDKDECNSKSFICLDSRRYLLCRNIGNGIYKPYNQAYECPATQVCHKSFNVPCAVAGSTAYNTTANSSVLTFTTAPPNLKNECKSKNFVCIDSKTYLRCVNMGNGIYVPQNQQHKCPGQQICHKSFDVPCAVAGTGNKSGGEGIHGAVWGYFAQILYVLIIIFGHNVFF